MMFQENEGRYRSVVEDLTEIISRFHADGTLLFVNDVYCRFFDKTGVDLLGKKWHPAAIADDVPMIEAKIATMSPKNPVVTIENRVYSGSGEIHWFQFVNRGFFDAGGRLQEIQSVGRDISALKKAEEALRRSEERLNLALAASRMGVWEWEVQTNTIYWSPESFEIFALESFTGTLESFTKAMHPEDVPRVMAAAERALAEHSDFIAEFRIVRPDGELRWLSDHGRPSYDADGVPVRLAGTVQDITDRKLAEAKLSLLHEKLSDLSAHLETAREQERLSISREIHDEIGQTLTALKLDLAWVNNRILSGNSELAERLAEIRSGLDYLIAKAQHITAELRPPLLDNLGLVAAVEWQVRQFRRRSGIECRLVSSECIGPLHGGAATAIMRILQEALTNILRHAQATLVQVCLSCTEETLELEVCDNGLGITPEELASATAFGVMGMYERARLCHGELEISGRQGQGTTLRLAIPLVDNPPAAPEDP
jgi:two-component system, NarL family, sensor histidine kinase UhpB